MNLLQVSSLTFDPSFKVKWGHHTKTAMYFLYIGPWAWNYYFKVTLLFLHNSRWDTTIVQ